jgi:hypothetical protein
VINRLPARVIVIGRAKRWGPRLIRFCLAVVLSISFARWWCGREAPAVMAGDPFGQKALAASAAWWIQAEPAAHNFATGSELFDGEWLFGTYIMSGLGLVQTALENPELKPQNILLIRQAIAKLLTPEVRSFDARRWKEDPIDSLDTTSPNGHAAYLGYLNLLLATQHLIDPAAPTAALHTRISAALEARLLASPIGLIQTYPYECYPIDNAAGIASLALRDRSAHGTISPPVRRWLDEFASRWRHAPTGLLYQAVDETSGQPTDYPRGSGTNLAAYFLSFADPSLARALFHSANASLAQSSFGFTALREYPIGIDGPGDIDSGPLLAGWSISSTGFSLAGCRQSGDLTGFTARWRLVHLFGAPAQRDGRSHFITGGRLGDAILFAMATALPPEILNRALPQPATP